MEPFLPYYDLYILQNLYTKKMRARRRSSHQRCSLRNGVLRNFTTFTEKHLRQSLFFNKVAGLSSPTLCRTIDTLVKTSLSLVLLFVGLLILWSRYYQNDGIAAMTIPVDFSNCFSAITSCLVFLNTISTWRDMTDIMFICLWEFGILWTGLVSYESSTCRILFCSLFRNYLLIKEPGGKKGCL